ncbi:hypothetical protein L484_015567 [Morus notabilis]|uniref:Uncharacterized protein n=1 Tax=Morus notabilis TaxID=981085 RepID=W9S2Y4_9ROSA|nr:hypothetical protein L484_015567 [Morus notabilis]
MNLTYIKEAKMFLTNWYQSCTIHGAQTGRDIEAGRGREGADGGAVPNVRADPVDPGGKRWVEGGKEKSDRRGPRGDLRRGGLIVADPVANEVAPPWDGGPEVGRRPREAAGVVGRGLDERGRRRGPIWPPDLGWEHHADPVREPPRESGGRLDREPSLDRGPMGARRVNHFNLGVAGNGGRVGGAPSRRVGEVWEENEDEPRRARGGQ